jgi:hypothetical protein
MKRRKAINLMAIGITSVALPRLALAAYRPGKVAVGAAWRGPKPDDPHFAGVVDIDWEKPKLTIRYAVPLPTRAHGLIAEVDGGLTICGARPGAWIMRCDGAGKPIQRVRLDEEGETRLGGHAALSVDGSLLFATGTDFRTGQGRILVRDRATFKKLDEWPTHGIDPHQVLLDGQGSLLIANGGVPRTRDDKKINLDRMDSSLVRLDVGSGRLLSQWRLDDPRLSLRHMAWNRDPSEADALLGIAMQAEHDDPAARSTAPILALFDKKRLYTPTRENDGVGYSGDIVPAHRAGFVVSSHQPGLAQLWHPSIAEKLQPIVKLKNASALAPWHGPGKGGGVLVATALGVGRWHPEVQPTLIPWPQPMALDNHWVLIEEV